MKRTAIMRTLVLGAVLSVLALPSAAQEPAGRFAISFNGGYQAATHNFTDHLTFDVYKETGTTDASYAVRGNALLDGGVAVRLWKRLAAGATVSHYSRSGAVHTVSHVPHPFFLQQLREVTGDASGVARSETGAHIQLIYLLPSSGKLRFAVSAGPSYITVNQAVITAVRYQEAYPYDVATFTTADTTSVNKSAAGYNAGADVAWMFTNRFGVGGEVRFARARVNLTTPNSRTLAVDAGGAQAGAGLRVHF